MKTTHDWRMKLNAQVDVIGVEMLSQQGEVATPLWWLNEALHWNTI
jgi:hypothetical protein